MVGLGDKLLTSCSGRLAALGWFFFTAEDASVSYEQVVHPGCLLSDHLRWAIRIERSPSRA